MAKKSKFLAILLALALVCMTGCGGAAAQEGEEVQVIRKGMLTRTNISSEELKVKVVERVQEDGPQRNVYFDTLSSMLLALQAGQIVSFYVPAAVGEYIVAGNDDLNLIISPVIQNSLSIAVLKEKSELLALMDEAIAALKADGTIEALVDTHIHGASPDTEATLVTIPAIEGADTIKVAITGDLPPIDYVSVDGKPAGFNIALLSAISQHAGVNIELVNIDSGARVIALTSGRADAVFWMRSMILPDGTVDADDDAPEDVALTEPYFTDMDSEVVLK